jgi:glycine C-acetyltransferase
VPIVTNTELEVPTVDPGKQWPALDPRSDDVQALLKKNMGRFFPARGAIDERNQALLQWIQRRRAAGLWPYGLCQLGPVSNEARVKHPSGVVVEGINLTTVDYLGLSQDLRLRDAARRAIDEHGVHTPSSGPLMGNTLASYELERSVAKLFNRGDSFLCPTGWAAGFAAISGLVRPDDIVIMDELAHQCLQQGAYASTPNVQTFKHLDNNDLESQLKAVREANATSAVVVVTEGLFGPARPDATMPASWSTVGRRHRARLRCHGAARYRNYRRPAGRARR